MPHQFSVQLQKKQTPPTVANVGLESVDGHRGSALIQSVHAVPVERKSNLLWKQILTWSCVSVPFWLENVPVARLLRRVSERAP